MSRAGDFVFYELLTTDAEAAAIFYGPILGWTLVRPEPPEHGFRILDAHGELLGGIRTLSEAVDGGMARPTWFGWVAVDDVDRAIQKVGDASGRPYAPVATFAGMGRSAVVVDPQGAAIGIVEGAASPSPHQAIGHCHWHELVTSDQGAAWSFYGQLFGWSRGDIIPLGPSGDYELLVHGGEAIGAVSPLQQARRPAWIYYFRVGDPDEACAHIREGGGTISYGPAERDGGTFTIIGRDPLGALFALTATR